jgi:nucleoside-diphosphate-sugar epimerase
VVKKAAAAAGLDPARFAGHSLRAGHATSAAANGAPERVIMAQDDLPGTVLRLPAVYGPDDGQHRLLPYVKRMDDGRPAILLSEEQATWRWSRGFVDDMAHGLSLATTDPRAAGRIYNIAEEDACSEAEWVRRIADAVGWTGKIVALPKEQLPEALREDGDFRHHLVSDTSRIHRELGYAEVTSRDEALRRAIEWERTSPPKEIDPAQFPYEAEDRVLAAR